MALKKYWVSVLMILPIVVTWEIISMETYSHFLQVFVGVAEAVIGWSFAVLVVNHPIRGEIVRGVRSISGYVKDSFFERYPVK